MDKIFPGICAGLVACLAGCDDGAPQAPGRDSAGQPPAVSPPAATLNCTTLSFAGSSGVDALPGGVWTGSLFDCANNVRQDGVAAIIAEDGRFRIMADAGQLLSGVLQTTGNLFTGGGIDFAADGVEYFSGPTTHLWVDGSIDERQTLNGRWGTEWGFYGYYSFGYDDRYERSTPLTDLGGLWQSYAHYLGSPVEGVWTVGLDGRFSGQDEAGCIQSGQYSLIDDRYSIVAVELTVTGCALAGSYSGLAAIEDLVDWWEKGMTISVDDGSRALFLVLVI